NLLHHTVQDCPHRKTVGTPPSQSADHPGIFPFPGNLPTGKGSFLRRFPDNTEKNVPFFSPLPPGRKRSAVRLHERLLPKGSLPIPFGRPSPVKTPKSKRQKKPPDISFVPFLPLVTL